ncbi:LysR family transcriptional regulator [Sediminibacterium goheungense]|uniref:DNA-binding transcriptional LysR family regulator n=1 Tax=Sediminibacterium goheungense TaxID=1086393 RepID=A0A4R6IZ74_9BACT|nr:LysR family transcriptional regulator [Sediminibacterium goheungense]TDO28179.1 DNA-binding transcriptional LysR family regulator [Sediminibacterium goheungense]
MLSVKHEVFLEVARHKSFSKASQSLFITQPAISKHIRNLEEQYATQLFERKGSGIELTEAGKMLYEKLAEVKMIQEQTAFEISAIKDLLQVKGTLQLGASTTVALYILPKILSAFQARYPQIVISLLNRNTEIVLQALLKGDINLGIVEGRSKLTQVSHRPFITDKVIAVCSRKSAITKKKLYDLEELKQLPLALREMGSGTLAALRTALEKKKIKMSSLQVKARLGGTEALKNFLVESDLLGFLPQRAIIKELEQGDLIEIHFNGLHIERNFYFIERKGENSELNRTLIRIAEKMHNL